MSPHRQKFSFRSPKGPWGAKTCPFGGSRIVVKAPWGYQAHDMDASHISTSANFYILMTTGPEAVSGLKRPKCEKSHFWGPFWPLLSLRTARTGRLVSKDFHTVCLDGTHPYHVLCTLRGPLWHSCFDPRGPFWDLKLNFWRRGGAILAYHRYSESHHLLQITKLWQAKKLGKQT